MAYIGERSIGGLPAFFKLFEEKIVYSGIDRAL